MTYEEALIYLNDIETDVIYKITGNEREAINIAKEAIEKQVPKKHHHTRIVKLAIDFRESVCPFCLGVIATKDKEYPKYCTWCGQALDWGEENE